MVELLQSISGYISVPLLLVFGFVTFQIWKRIELLKNEQIKFGQELVKLKNVEIQVLERHIGVLREERIDPNSLLASVEIIEKASKKEIEEMRYEYEKALNLAKEEKGKRQHLEDVFSKINSIINQDNPIIQIISHELSSYVVGIRAAASRLNMNPEIFISNPDRAKMYLSDIEAHASSLLSFMQGISSLSQKNVDPIHLSQVYIFKDIVIPVIHELSAISRKSGINVAIDCPDSINNLSLNADKGVLSRAFYNILLNAIQFSEKANTITVKLVTDKEYLVIRVMNYGLPVKVEDESKIFEPYYRAPNAMKKSVRGLGFGLYVARKALELHGGTVSLTKAKCPTEFSLKLPLKIKHYND